MRKTYSRGEREGRTRGEKEHDKWNESKEEKMAEGMEGPGVKQQSMTCGSASRQ